MGCKTMAEIPEFKKFTLIIWHPITERPEEGRYVLIQYIDHWGDRACDWAAYENEHFTYTYPSGAWGIINEDVLLGWSYIPFND